MKAKWLVVLFGLLLGLSWAQETVTLRAWTIGPDDASITRMTNLQAAVESLNAELEAEGADVRVALDAEFDSTDWDPYLRRVLLAFQSNNAPDIVQASAALIGTWAPAGFIEPLDEYIDQFEQFDDVVNTLWNAVTYDDRIYAIPQDTEARPLYFNKTLLSELGWSDEEIESLPERIASGEFTWGDVLSTAQQAVEQGVVRPGNGFYHRPRPGPDFAMWYRSFGGEVFDEETDQLVFSRDAALRYFTWLADAVEANVLQRDRLSGDWQLYHQPVTAGEVLFFSGGTWNWAEWVNQYVADRGGQDWLFENFGFAPQPSWEQGGTAVTLSNPQAYMVSADSNHKELAVRLLAHTTVPELDAKHAVESAHLPILTSTPETLEDRFLQEVSYLLEYSTFAPIHAQYSNWQDALYQGVSAVESGDLTPEATVDLVASQMQRQLGDQVRIQ
ncbi:MAG: extracellular solute-binding protein [Deinococcota bacterium]|nr:extracellular solute-binding protein [Deinococcota bacterium]